MTGFFISLEGGDGVGKSTQIDRLTTWLEQQGKDVLSLLNHSSTPLSVDIRELIISHKSEKWPPMVDALMYFAVRFDMWTSTIKPALEKNKIVVCDRYMDSTTVYQGWVGGIGIDKVEAMHNTTFDSAVPDLTIILDAPPEIAFERMGKRTFDKFESKGQEFHRKVREGYLQIAKRHPDRCIVVDATQPVDVVTDLVISAVRQRLQKRAA